MSTRVQGVLHWVLGARVTFPAIEIGIIWTYLHGHLLYSLQLVGTKPFGNSPLPLLVGSGIITLSPPPCVTTSGPCRRPALPSAPPLGHDFVPPASSLVLRNIPPTAAEGGALVLGILRQGLIKLEVLSSWPHSALGL